MNPIRRVSAAKYRGLGDVVHAVAQPVAAVLDAVLGTRIKGCSGCAKRREQWNQAVPFDRKEKE